MNKFPCAGATESIGGYSTIIPVKVTLSPAETRKSAVVSFDSSGGFLLRQISFDGGEGWSVQMTDTRRNRSFFSRPVDRGVFPPIGGAGLHQIIGLNQLPRPVYCHPSSDLSVSFYGDAILAPQDCTIYLHGFRYRGPGGPIPPPESEQFFIYAARSLVNGEQTLLVEQDHEFVLTQPIIKNAGLSQITDKRLTRSLFDSPIDPLVFDAPVGTLSELRDPYAFGANTRVSVSEDTGDPLASFYLVGYKRYR